MIKPCSVFFVLPLFVFTNTPIIVYSQSKYIIEKLPATINSIYEDIKPLLSSNGDSLFFIRSYSPENIGGEKAGEDIWLSIFSEGNGWSVATNSFGYPNNSEPDIFIGLSTGNEVLYTIVYKQPGKNRIVSINQHNLKKRFDVKPTHNLKLEIGKDYHDLYLNPEGNMLLISMNDISSIGQEDIYVAVRNSKLTWSKPINLGPTINSRGFEISPFLSDDGKSLYFASDGHDGLGDADIFYSQRMDEGWLNWSKPVNMGPPINSSKFDAYLLVNKKRELFLASNRNSKYSNIYKITKKKNEIKDIEKAKNNLKEKATSKTKSKLTSEVINLLTIYFDLNKSKPKKVELDKLAVFALKFIETDTHLIINGYTDDSGNKLYNKKLSEKRARFVYRYFKKYGISENRLHMEGRGIFTTPGNVEIPASKKRKVELIRINHIEP